MLRKLRRNVAEEGADVPRLRSVAEHRKGVDVAKLRRNAAEEGADFAKLRNVA